MHFTDAYCARALELLHLAHPVHRFFKQEVVTVDGLLTAVLVTYDGVSEDHREIFTRSYAEFIKRMTRVKPDWSGSERGVFEGLATMPEKTMLGWEGRTIYFIKGGQNADRWTDETAQTDVLVLLAGTAGGWGAAVHDTMQSLRADVPVGHTAFSEFERVVRVTFNYLFHAHLGEGAAQVRTAGENEGVEIRDILFTNAATKGFWKDLKDGPYRVSEVVVDAKNTDDLTRDDVRQLYCYLKPALGLCGFLVCRAPPSGAIKAFNRALFKNFAQTRCVLLLDEKDLHHMVAIAIRGQDASDFVRARMAEFARAI